MGTLDPHNSINIHENQENILPGLYIRLHPNIKIFLIAIFQATDKCKNLHRKMKLGKIFDFQLHGQTLTIF